MQTVSTLLCHAHVPMALRCLGSVARHLAMPVAFRIHDDGTLTEDDVARLGNALGRVVVVWRRDADERMRDLHPRLRHVFDARARLPLVLKAFDIPNYATGSSLFYSDSDVLYLRPFSLPREMQAKDGSQPLIFMRDRENSYSLRSWQKLLSPTLRLPSRVNTGIILARGEWVDVEYLEWFVGRRLHHGIYPMLEQTFLAALGAQRGCALLDPRQVRVMREHEGLPLVAGHFTAHTRHLLAESAAQADAVPGPRDPVVLETIPAGRCTALDLLGYEVRRAARRLRRAATFLAGASST